MRKAINTKNGKEKQKQRKKKKVLGVYNEEDYKIYEEIVYYYESFKDCKE